MSQKRNSVKSIPPPTFEAPGSFYEPTQAPECKIAEKRIHDYPSLEDEGDRVSIIITPSNYQPQSHASSASVIKASAAMKMKPQSPMVFGFLRAEVLISTLSIIGLVFSLSNILFLTVGSDEEVETYKLSAAITFSVTAILVDFFILYTLKAKKLPFYLLSIVALSVTQSISFVMGIVLFGLNAGFYLSLISLFLSVGTCERLFRLRKYQRAKQEWKAVYNIQ